jgi:hypothetical protein
MQTKVLTVFLLALHSQLLIIAWDFYFFKLTQPLTVSPVQFSSVQCKCVKSVEFFIEIFSHFPLLVFGALEAKTKVLVYTYLLSFLEGWNCRLTINYSVHTHSLIPAPTSLPPSISWHTYTQSLSLAIGCPSTYSLPSVWEGVGPLFPVHT